MNLDSGRGGSSAKLGLLIGGGAVVVLLVVVLVIGLTRAGGEDPIADPTPPPVPTQPDPSGSAGPGGDPTQAGPARCDAGNQMGVPVEPGVDTQTAGVVFRYPDDYTFRPDINYFPFLNDVAARMPDDQSTAVFVGGLPTEAGFADQERASVDLFECLLVGFGSTGMTDVEVHDDTAPRSVGAVPAYTTTGTARYADGTTEEWAVHILDAGQEGSWTAVITYVGEDGEQQTVDDILATFRT